MLFSFIHISDIHLGRPFSNLSKYSYDDKTAAIYKNAVERTFNNIIDYAIVKNVDFVLIAGDTFDSSEHDFNSKLILKEGLKKLDDADIKVFMICGNHDPVYSYNKNTFNYSPDSNIKIIGVNTEPVCTLPVFNKNNEKIALIHALSFTEDKFEENPAKYFKRADDAGLFNIGLLHCDLNADKSSPYAPCNISDLKSLGYDYFALGHIHIPSLEENAIQYAGTIQGRNTKETGAHGIKYIKVDNGKIIKNNFIPLDIIRFVDVSIDLSSAKNSLSAFDIIIEEINLITNKEKNSCELFLITLNLEGYIGFYDELTYEFYNTICEKLKTDFNVYISQIINSTIPIVDNKLLLEDDGISGELYKTLQDDSILNNSFSDIEKQLNNLIIQCNLNENDYNKFKEDVIKNAKEKCINLCSKVYNFENKEE